jgi:hypothetical protein
MLTDLLQKSGKKVSPQMLNTLLSMVGEAAKKEESSARRPGRGYEVRRTGAGQILQVRGVVNGQGQ